MQGVGLITFVKTIGERIKWARVNRELTQRELAKKAGVSTSTIGNLEAGIRDKPRELVAIAMALKASIQWVNSGKGDWDDSEKQEVQDPAADPLTAKGVLTALADTIASVPEILQSTARDALVKWAMNESSFEQMVAAIDTLSRAGKDLNAPSASTATTPPVMAEWEKKREIVQKFRRPNRTLPATKDKKHHGH